MTGPADAGDWPPGAVEEIDNWRQGHVLTGVPVVVLGPNSSHGPMWAAGAPCGFEIAGVRVLAEPDGVLRHAMVVSHGCELVKRSFPALTVVPVYEASEILTAQQQEAARAGMTWHLVQLTADWTSDGMWVADLRLEFPVDKTFLLGISPIEGFKDEPGYAKLGERLASIRQRAAVPQATSDHVVTPLREHLAGLRAAGQAPLAGVREIRVQSNHHTSPTAVTLFVVAEVGATIDVTLWTDAVDAIHEHAAANGVALAGPEIGTLWDMTAADYVTSHAVGDADSS